MHAEESPTYVMASARCLLLKVVATRPQHRCVLAPAQLRVQARHQHRCWCACLHGLLLSMFANSMTSEHACSLTRQGLRSIQDCRIGNNMQE
jgi:hypothetical protein